MRGLTLAVAAALSVAVTAPTARAFSLSSVSELLSHVGVHVTLPEVTVDLPEKAETAVANALSHATMVIDDIFDDGHVTLPNIDVDQIISDAHAKAQMAVDDALSRAEEILGDLDLPNVVLPEVDLPSVTVPNADVQEIVDNALSRAQHEVDSALDRAQEAIDDAHGVLEDVVSDHVPNVESILEELSETLPPVAATAIQSALSHVSYLSLPATAAVAVPEPTSLAVVAAGLVGGVAARRRR